MIHKLSINHMALPKIENGNIVYEGAEIINQAIGQIPVKFDVSSDGMLVVTRDNGQQETVNLPQFYATLNAIAKLILPGQATEEKAGVMMIATLQKLLAGEDNSSVITPALLRTYLDSLDLPIADPDSNFTGINVPLDIDPKAVIEIKAHGGLEVIGKGKNDKGDIRLRLDLEDLPATGKFSPMLISDDSKIAFRASFAEFMALATGAKEQTPDLDPGPPVAPEIADIVISSGAGLNITLPAFTKTDGTKYPYTISYAVETPPAGFAFSGASRRLSGTRTVAEETTWPLVLVGTVGPGLQVDTVVRKPFNLRVLAAPVTQKPQPTVTQISALTLVQGQTTPLQAEVSYGNGVTQTGTWSAAGLPNGLSIDPATGKFPGFPTLPGEYYVTLTWTDSDGQTDDMQFTMVVAPNPVNAWLKGIFVRIDVNTGGVDIFIQTENTSAVLVAFRTLDSTVYTGNAANGSQTGTDPVGAGHFQSAVPSTGNAEFNFRAGFYAFSLNPRTGGLAGGKAYAVDVKRPGDTASEDFFFYYNPVQNTPITPLLTEAPTAGTGTNQLVPPNVGTVPVIVGQTISKRIADFNGWQSGEVKSFSYSGVPTGVSISLDTNTNEFVLSGSAAAAGNSTIGVVATGDKGSQGSFSFNLSATVAASQITAIYRRFYASGQGIIIGGSGNMGGIITYGNVSFEAVVSGTQIVEVNANRSTLPVNTDWTDITKGSNGRFGFVFGQLNGGETLTIKFRIKGQTSEIVQTYTVLSPLAANSIVETLVWPEALQQGNNLTTNQLFRVSNTDPENAFFNPTLTWVTVSGRQWLRVQATLPAAIRKWQVYYSDAHVGEGVSEVNILVPPHTQTSIKVMDSNKSNPYDPTAQIARVAELMLESGDPTGSPIAQIV